jgi:cytochrome b subunit of formate dehydrogenase
MSHRIPLRIGLAIGCVLLATAAYAAGSKPPNCGECHTGTVDKLAKSAHSGLSCATCHDGFNPATHPVGITKPECATCHQDQAGDYALGVHGQAHKRGDASAPDCALCHGSAHELMDPKSQDFRKAVPDTCGMCHAEVAQQYHASVHGQALARGVMQAPLCTDCHGEHKIIKPDNAASPVNAANIRDTCASCHGDVRLTRKFGLPADRIVSFDSSYHGLAAKAGSQTVANCASCHGVHNILASSDPKSTINPKNLPRTCGKCHPGAGERFAISQVHVAEGGNEPAALRWVREFYLLMIPVTIGLMLLHNGGDWIRKLIRLRFQARAARVAAGHGGPRMLPFERLQHAVLAIAFITLAWTGFALKYPDQWWARPLLMMEGKYMMRSLIHRVAAALFIALALTHAVSLIVSRKLREHWKEMLPAPNDAREALSNMAYNLGMGKRKPGRSPHSYIEKAEYWALVWGSVVMAATGLMLWANNIALKLLPKQWLDVATSVHLYEAVLATLAILVWHFYSVMFDPDVYPLDTSFLTGRSPNEEQEARAHAKQPREIRRVEPQAETPPAKADAPRDN